MSERIKCPCGATVPTGEDCAGLFHDEWVRRAQFGAMRQFARNLRDAAGCALAFELGGEARGDHHGMVDGTEWQPGRGIPAPGIGGGL